MSRKITIEVTTAELTIIAATLGRQRPRRKSWWHWFFRRRRVKGSKRYIYHTSPPQPEMQQSFNFLTDAEVKERSVRPTQPLSPLQPQQQQRTEEIDLSNIAPL